jgi:CubicO group peptidase (beta-lactamase class C family)
MLMMSTGFPYRRIEGTFFLVKAFSSDITTFYGDHLRETVLGLHAGGDPIGKFFNYNDYYPLVEGMILERAYGMSVSELTQHKLWEPMGMESGASWSIDQVDSGFESDTLWTVVRGSALEEGESQGLPVWSRHVGDPILKSNITHRVDFALFMVAALTDDDLISEAPAIVGCRTPSALAHAPAGGRVTHG